MQETASKTPVDDHTQNLNFPKFQASLNLTLNKNDAIHIASLVGQYERYMHYQRSTFLNDQYQVDENKITLVKKLNQNELSISFGEATFLLKVFNHWDRVYGENLERANLDESNVSLSQEFNKDFWFNSVKKSDSEGKSLFFLIQNFTQNP